MPTTGHKIADAVFNFAFASVDETVRGAAVLPGLIKTQLVPCMDDVFDRWGMDPDVVCIDRLAVDLGSVSYEDMARVLAQRLEQALNAALQDRSPAAQTSCAHSARRIAPHQAGLDLIARYLQTGTVPWTAEKSSPAELNHILETLIDQAPQTLLAFLKSQNQKTNPVLQRLTLQFKPDLLQHLAKRLAPAEAPSLARLVNALAALHKAAALASVTDRELVGALWEGILRQLLLPGGGPISPHTLVLNALYATAPRHRISRSHLFHHLTRKWRTAADIETKKLITAVIRHLGPGGTEHEDPRPTADPWAPLESKLLDALLGHRMDGFARAWPVMVTRFAGPTRQVVRHTARQARVRRTIARRFTPRQFGQLVVLLEPRHAHFVNNVLEHQKTLGQAMHRTSPPPETMGIHLREFTLAYLLSKGATRFNRKQYCAGMIRRLAARHNMAYEALLEDFHTFFSSAVADHDDTGRQLREILDEIRGNPVSLKSPPPEENEENQPTGLDGQAPEEFPVLLDRCAPLPGLTGTLRRLAARHPHWARLVSRSLLEMDPALDPDAVIRHLIRCLPNCAGTPPPGAFYQQPRRELPPSRPPEGNRKRPGISHDLEQYQTIYQELGRELTIGRSPTHTGVGPSARMACDLRSRQGTPASPLPQAPLISQEPEATAAPDRSVFVQNAGLVLVAHYLPWLFGMLGLTAKNRFKDHPAAGRALHLLEFIANERTSAPEFQLALNKILCGVAAATPIIPGIDITPKERSAVDSLIRSIIEHWKILGNTSPEGLRTTFLQREGYLTLKEDAWHLRVNEGSFDMLLDQLPWSYAVIRHPWMTRMLYVNWRTS